MLQVVEVVTSLLASRKMAPKPHVPVCLKQIISQFKFILFELGFLLICLHDMLFFVRMLFVC